MTILVNYWIAVRADTASAFNHALSYKQQLPHAGVPKDDAWVFATFNKISTSHRHRMPCPPGWYMG